jgi:hypothetical protein
MFRSKAFGFGLILLGCLFIAVSVYLWTQAIKQKWVFAQSSNEHALRADQIWSVTSTCLAHYLVREMEKAKTTLQTHIATIPSEVRAWINRPQRTPTLSSRPANERPIDRLRREYEESKRDFEETQNFLNLQSKYINWFAAKSALEDDVNQQQKRLDTLENQEGIGGVLRLKDLEKDKADSLLGLTVFSEEQRKRLKEACLQIIPIKMIATRSYSINLWHLRVDQYAAFVGMALLLTGLLRIFAWQR